MTVGVVGDFDPAFRAHRATDEALGHAARALSAAVTVCWLPTESLAVEGAEPALETCDGLWISPGSPYPSGSRASVTGRSWPSEVASNILC